MPRFRVIPAFVCSLGLILTPLTAQQTSPPTISTQTPQRDPQALAVLNQALVTAGGAEKLATIQDFTATGSVTYFWAGKEVIGDLKLRGRGLDQFRLDANTSLGLRSWSVSEGTGSLRDIDGGLTEISYGNSINCGSLTMPYINLLAALTDTTTAVMDLGVVNLNGTKAEQIRVQRKVSPNDLTGLLNATTVRDYFFDVTSVKLVSVRDSIYDPNSAKANYVHDLWFSDYRDTNGMLVPWGITEQVNGQKTWAIVLTGMTFNQGLTDADFQL